MNRVKRKSGVREMSDFSEWMLPYGNLMMILMIFFLMLYTFAYLGGTQFEEALTKIEATVLSAEQQRRMRKKLEEAQMATKLSDQLSKIAKVEINAQRIKIQLPSPVLFESASAELKNEAMSALHQIAKSIKVLPNEIIVEGHTDNVPISAGLKYKNNWELSAARAFSVVDYFVEKGKIDPRRFTVYGFGEFRTVAPNDIEENRAKNRRIEISIIRSKEKDLQDKKSSGQITGQK